MRLDGLQKGIHNHAIGLDLADEESFVDICLSHVDVGQLFHKPIAPSRGAVPSVRLGGGGGGGADTNGGPVGGDELTRQLEAQAEVESARKTRFIHNARDMLLANGIVKETDFWKSRTTTAPSIPIPGVSQINFNGNQCTPWKITLSCNDRSMDPKDAMRLLGHHSIMKGLSTSEYNHNPAKTKNSVHNRPLEKKLHEMFFARHLAFAILQLIDEHRQRAIRRKYGNHHHPNNHPDLDPNPNPKDTKYANIPIYVSNFRIVDTSQPHFTSIKTGFGLQFQDKRGTPMEIFAYADDLSEKAMP